MSRERSRLLDQVTENDPAGLFKVSGGRNGSNRLAPNTLFQYDNILQALRDVEINGYKQQQFDLFVLADSFFARLSDYRLSDRECYTNWAELWHEASISRNRLPLQYYKQ